MKLTYSMKNFFVCCDIRTKLIE